SRSVVFTSLEFLPDTSSEMRCLSVCAACNSAQRWRCEPLGRDWKTKRKDRPMAELAGNTNASAVRLYNRLHDSKSHSGTLHPISLDLPPVKLVKNYRSLQVIDTTPPICDAGDE